MAHANATKEDASYEVETSGFGAPRGVEKTVVDATFQSGSDFWYRQTFFHRRDAIEQSEDGADYSGYPHLKLQNIFRRELDGVNYLQCYLAPTQENLEMILDVVAYHQLEPGDFQRFEEVRRIVCEGTPYEQERLIEGIQQIRIFDVRNKQIQFDGSDNQFNQLDIKWKPDELGTVRKKLVWRAKDNGDDKIIAAMDDIYARSEEEGIPMSRVERYFLAFEWLPHTVLEHFHIRERLQGRSEQVSQYVYQLLGHLFGAKLDIRADVIRPPKAVSGEDTSQICYLVTREAELKAGGEQLLREYLELARDQVLGLIGTAFKGSGYVGYQADELDLASVSLHESPQEVLDDLMASRGLDEQAREAIFAEMREHVERVMGVFSFEPEEQITVPNPDGMKFEHITRTTFLDTSLKDFEVQLLLILSE